MSNNSLVLGAALSFVEVEAEPQSAKLKACGIARILLNVWTLQTDAC